MTGAKDLAAMVSFSPENGGKCGSKQFKLQIDEK